jgi:hypothetical protein
MIRLTKALAVAAVVVLTIPSIASALGISIISSSLPDGGTLDVGGTVTFTLAIENNASADVFGLSADVTGYDPIADTSGDLDGNLSFQSGTSVPQVLSQFSSGGAGFGGLEGPNGGPQQNFFVSNVDPQANTANLGTYLSVSGVNNTGINDTGINGNSLSAGGVHFQVTFANTWTDLATSGAGVKNLVLNFGLTGVGALGVTLPSTGETFNLTVVPEPGTALLMGLGLAGLAIPRRS